MAQYRIRDPDELVECPYDPVHMIRMKRFQYHLMKCRRNYMGSNYSTCPFNACHEVPRPELRHHIANCPDKAVLEKDMLQNSAMQEEGAYFHGCTDVPRVDNSWMPRPTENWDAEISVYHASIIDNSVFSVPRRHSKSYDRMSPQEKLALMDNLKQRGVKLEVKSDSENVRLPHHQPKVLGSGVKQELSTTRTGALATREVRPNLEIHAGLLQSLARGRGIRTNTAMEPRVGLGS